MSKCLLQSQLLLAILFVGALVNSVLASPHERPGDFLTVQATDPLATEPGGQPGTFTLVRAGKTNEALTAEFTLSGTARNGVDYAAIPLAITFAPGQISSNLSIAPVAEPTATGYKTAVLTLPRHDTNFSVGSLDRATVYIVYAYTNVPPAVKIVAPTNLSSFLSLPNIELAANASDSNGWVTSVSFFANGNFVGSVTNHPFLDDPWNHLVLRESHGSIVPLIPGSRESRFQFVWTSVPTGNYTLTAVATDNAGLQTTSDPVNIEVTTGLPTPRIKLINPVNNSEFPDIAPINLVAAAGEVGGVITTVEFLTNGVSLGVVSNYLAAEPSSQFHLQMQWLPYYFRWTNAQPGSNILTAIATDNNGAKVTSAPIDINVTTNSYRHHHGL
ncbi:MAG TPA: Ig-like domain-containing protein [Verrucomicrobiae bacterium]|jgi:hypothetical protein